MPNKDGKQEALSLEEVSRQIQEMLENAREEAAKIVADAKASVGGELSDDQKAAKAKRDEYWNELVEVKLFKDNNKYKDDVFVAVNGENCVIKRGERVKVKRKFANVLDLSDMQDYETNKLIEKHEREFLKTELN